MRRLTDFLNHGILPFIGRTQLVAEITQFWRGAIRRGSLELYLVEGPAGCGKSRLVEELAPEIRTQGGIFLRVRLYPETPAALTSDLERKLSLVEERLGLTLSKDGNLHERLRHLVRLRPTLLAIEDLHLLDDESRREFDRLLGDIADEPLGLLVVTRPINDDLRGLVDPYLTRSDRLDGLDAEDVALLWQELFGNPCHETIAATLADTTQGNPLVIRSTLRGSIEKGIIVETSGQWGLNITAEEFAATLQRDVNRLIEGMILHLADDEKESVYLLARLGEIFAREAAIAVLDDEEIIENLLFKGVLHATKATPPSLNRMTSDQPSLRFAHTLLHEHCLAQPAANPDRLIRTLLDDMPQHSYRLFVSLGDIIDTVPLDKEQIEQIFIAIRDVLNGAHFYPERRRLQRAHHLLDRLVERGLAMKIWDEEEQVFYRGLCHILWTICLVGSWRDPESYRRSVLLEEITRNPTSYRLAKMRLRALADRVETLQSKYEDKATVAILEQIDPLLAAFPDLELDPQYSYLLGRFLQRSPHLTNVCRQVIGRYKALGTRVDVMSRDAELRYKRLGPFILSFFETRQECADRLQLLDEMNADPDVPEHLLTVLRESFLCTAGYFERLVHSIDSSRRWVDQFNDEVGRSTLDHLTRALDLFTGNTCPEDPDAFVVETGKLYDEIQRQANQYTWHLATYHSLVIGFDAAIDRLSHLSLAEIAMHTSGTTLRFLLRKPDQPAAPIGEELAAAAVFQREITGEKVAIDELRRALCTIVEAEPLHVSSFSETLAVAEYLLSLGTTKRATLDIDRLVAEGILRWVDFFAEAPAPGIIRRTLADFRTLLTEQQQRTVEKAEKKGIAAVTAMRRTGLISDETAEPPPAEGNVTLRMINEIEVRTPGAAEFRRVRGSGIKRALGTLVADRMTNGPLAFDEMARLFSGDDAIDPERGRKFVNDSVYKLRKLLGPEAIIAERGNVRLDTDKVDVDLIRLVTLLKEAEEGVDEGMAARTIGGLTEGLDLFAVGVAWPGLYDPFFEAARSELEWRLRRVLLRAATLVDDGGDIAAAEALLGHGAASMPGDEEITEALGDLLRKQGKFIEAERLRMNDAAV